MATDDADRAALEDLSPKEARKRLMQLIAEDDIADHEDIYDALARE